MAQTYILLLLLLLWNNVESSLTNQVCSRLPTFEHGFVSDEYKKVQYQQGDVIYFSCNPGYTTGFNVSYICTERGWKETTNGNCVDERTFQLPLGCLPPPALKNGQILYFNYFYADGDQATFKCDPDYKMTGQPFKICKNGQWTGDPQCEEISCKLPSSNSEDPVVRVAVGTRMTVQCERGGSSKQVQCLPSGWWDSPLCPELFCLRPSLDNFELEEEKSEYKMDEVLRYRCNQGYRKVDGRPSLCQKVGQSMMWSPLPQCEALSCEAPPPVPGLTVEGLPFDDGPILPDRLLTFSCPPGHSLNGSQTLVCGKNGTWDSPFPNCIDSCDVVGVSHTVLVSPRNVGHQFQAGQSLTFRCRDGRHVLQGVQRVTCLENGLWSQPFPTCSGPRGCGTPPPLEHGDYFAFTTEFEHNTRVEYQCQSKYTMQGGPHKTCHNGEWTGEITCLKPCTVNEDLLWPNKLEFKWSITDKLYAPHGDFVSFRCAAGAVHDGVMNLRQQCIDGTVVLPRCV